MKYHLFAHNEKNNVKVGDIVKKYITKIGSIGTANGSYLGHLHFSISEGLTVAQLRSYINGWSVEKVKQFYRDPRGIDFEKMFGRKMDVGKAGYAWLQEIANSSPHPGVDINGTGGGNSDIGYEFTASCDGKVIYVSNSDEKDGWGKMVVVEEGEAEPKIIDLSHWNTVKDWEKLKDDIIIHKCTEGTSFLDPNYNERKDKIAASYHFAKGGSPQEEARWFLKNADENILILDWEIEHADPVGWCKTFKAEIDKAGKIFWFYTNDARAIKYAWPEDWFMWVARYSNQ